MFCTQGKQFLHMLYLSKVFYISTKGINKSEKISDKDNFHNLGLLVNQFYNELNRQIKYLSVVVKATE